MNEQAEMSKVIVGYFASWAIYSNHFVWDIDLSKVTHLNYAFARISENGLVALTDPWADTDQRFTARGDTWNDSESNLFGTLGQLFKLKNANRNLKTGISIGGWSDSKYFSKVAATPESRAAFIDSAIDMMINFGMDYIDIDWEYPVEGGLEGNLHSPQDGENFVRLLEDLWYELQCLNEQSGRRHFITIATPAGPYYAVNFELPRIHQFVEFINIMTYDFSGNWSPTIQHHSNLLPYDGGSISVSQSVQYYLSQGVPANKIVLGVPFYGRMFQCVGSCSIGGLFTAVNENQEIINYNKIDTTNVLWDDVAKAPIAILAARNIAISFENTRSLQLKLQFLKDNNLRGVMFWESSGDYPKNDSRSLLSTIFSSLSSQLERINNALSFPDSKYPNVN